MHHKLHKYNNTKTIEIIAFAPTDAPLLYLSQAYLEDQLTGVVSRLELTCVAQVYIHIYTLKGPSHLIRFAWKRYIAYVKKGDFGI